jgi:glucose-6-phosphate isomerase
MKDMVSKVVSFDMKTGKAPESDAVSLKRPLSALKKIFNDQQAADAILANGDPLVYEFYDLHMPEREGALAFGSSIVYPGTVGKEFHMTKGHFHTIIDTAEVYYCLSGYGMMMMESPEGDIEYQEMRPGQAVYVPGRYAHRSINLSLTETLVTFFVFRADAGHDYGTIEERGFRKLVVAEGDGYAVVDNSSWAEA